MGRNASLIQSSEPNWEDILSAACVQKVQHMSNEYCTVKFVFVAESEIIFVFNLFVVWQMC